MSVGVIDRPPMRFSFSDLRFSSYISKLRSETEVGRTLTDSTPSECAKTRLHSHSARVRQGPGKSSIVALNLHGPFRWLMLNKGSSPIQ